MNCKTTLVLVLGSVLLLGCALSALPALAEDALNDDARTSVPAASKAADELLVYSLRPERLGLTSDPGDLLGEVAWFDGDRQLASQSFLVGAGQESVLIPIRPVAESTARLEVTVGDVLLDVLTLDQLWDVTLAAWREEPAKLRSLALDAARRHAAPQPGASKPTLPVERVSLAKSTCSSCDTTYIQCVMGCPDATCQAGCDADYQQCLLTNCPSLDHDRDGVPNGSDNCPEVANANQANCDGDAYGDVCDSLNATYANSGPEQVCEVDRDGHFTHYSLELYVGRQQVDTSSCNAPSRWNRRIANEAYCFNVSEPVCCGALLSNTIFQYGGEPGFWCDDAIIDNYNECQ